VSKTEIIAEAGRQEVVITHWLKAPREKVFAAICDPEVLPQWWGPSRLSTRVEEFNATDAGRWRVIQSDDSGHEFAFNGVYHLSTAPSMQVRTFEFEGLPERHVAMETLTLTEKDGGTLWTATSVFQSVADRDAMIASGMESGVREGMERLGEYLLSV
jgi:uncharacterized protein YndB with AHSA1/START domain